MTRPSKLIRGTERGRSSRGCWERMAGRVGKALDAGPRLPQLFEQSFRADRPILGLEKAVDSYNRAGPAPDEDPRTDFRIVRCREACHTRLVLRIEDTPDIAARRDQIDNAELPNDAGNTVRARHDRGELFGQGAHDGVMIIG